MRVKDLMDQLIDLPPDLVIEKWMLAKLRSGISTLDFETSGRAIRILLKILGEAKGNANQDMSGHSLNHRSCIWVSRGIQKDQEAFTALEEAGIHDYYISPGEYICIHIPYSAYYSSFTSSDDPTVWRQRQERNELNARNRIQRKKQKQEERLKEREKENEAWNANWKEQQRLAKEEEEQKQNLIALGQQFVEVKEKAKQIKVDNIDVTRAVKAYEGD